MNSSPLIFSGRERIYRDGVGGYGATRASEAYQAQPRGVAPPRLVGSSLHVSGLFLRQYFLYIPQKILVNFQVIPRTFISAQKQHHGNFAENSVSPG